MRTDRRAHPVLGLLLALTVGSAAAQPPPAWTADAVWYQVFPERFRNGDPANDPTAASLEAPVPASWAPTPWTGDWYARADWERALGPDFYENGVFHRRYGGDLQGILDKLGYLDSLGVTALYLNPVFHAPSLHKYDGASFHHIDPHFGPDPAGDLAIIAAENATGRAHEPHTWQWTAADVLFLRLLDAAHARGMRVVIDGVFNHTGTRFFAFEDLRARQQASPYAGWYEVNRFDSAATPDTSEFDWNGWWGYKGLPVLANSPDSTTLAEGPAAYVHAVTRRWMDPDGDGDPRDGIDGWRLDVSEEVPDGFWQDWNARVRALNPEAVTVAEIWSASAAYLARTGFSSAMNYNGFAIPVEDFLVDRQTLPSDFAREVRERFGVQTPATGLGLLNLIDSHDTDRIASMLVNRGRGDYDRNASPRGGGAYEVRAPNEAERDVQRMIALLQATMPGAPMLYYGTETGMWGADDPDVRKPMLWPDLGPYADEAAHPQNRPRRPEGVRFDTALHDFYRSVLRLRGRSSALRRGTFEIITADDTAGTLAFRRRHNDEEVIVMLNRSDETQRVFLAEGRLDYPIVPIFASRGSLADVPSLNISLGEDGSATYGNDIPPRTVVVFRRVTEGDVRPGGLLE